MQKSVLILILTLVVISCRKKDAPAGPSVFFEEPQPINDSELDHFPSKFKGLYMGKDSTFIRINDDVAQYEYFYKYKIHKNELDSMKTEFNLIDGKLISKWGNETFDISSQGDSLLMSQKKIDTLFRFSYYQKAKRINGNLVLSTKDSIFWTVQNLSIEKNNLKLKDICLYTDIRKMDSVTLIKSKMLDSTSYLLKPTRREFGRILRIKNLGYLQEFKKVKN
ncbi:hypothetical protein [Flavobacterium sp. ABG]|uniref:hypothetical protein n=1 Tax=Flavobacterium sp. ABG TaxID=1423322 RepID=UPI00064A8855|nr:hypothetical protein [Flavobacterium sp. ABG]KLT70063.1 hypothetical protein AB674_10230 [Flavobacterium sp. ABG]